MSILRQRTKTSVLPLIFFREGMCAMKKVALIGCGALGSIIAHELKKILSDDYELTGVLDFRAEAAQELAKGCDTRACANLDELLSDAEMIIEAADGEVVRAYGEIVLNSGCDLVILSVGVLSDKSLKSALENAARSAGKKIYVVNGALGGLDVLQTMSMMAPTIAVISNTKSPGSLNGAPFLEGKDLSEDKTVKIFEGSVDDAIRGFPKNVNVAVATALASKCPDAKVIITSVPGTKDNKHCVHAENGIITADISISSFPDPDNPKSSSSAAWSVLNLLRNLAAPVFYY